MPRRSNQDVKPEPINYCMHLKGINTLHTQKKRRGKKNQDMSRLGLYVYLVRLFRISVSIICFSLIRHACLTTE